MYRIGVAEDEAPMREQLREYLMRYAAKRQLVCKADFYESADALLEAFEGQYDLLFLDVQMAGTDGMEAARRIRTKDELVIIVFITGFVQYAVEGYSVNAMSFMVKPLRYEAFADSLGQALQRVERMRPTLIRVKTDRGMAQLMVDDILYVETVARRLLIHTPRGEYSCWETMQDMEAMLPRERFFRTHKAYLVNLSQVENVNADGMIRLKQGMVLLSRRKRREFMEALLHYASGRI